jgi:hypothetical protein
MDIQQEFLSMREPHKEQGTLRDAIAKAKAIHEFYKTQVSEENDYSYNVDLGATTAWILTWKLDLCKMIAEKFNCKYLHQNRTAAVYFEGTDLGALICRNLCPYLIERIRQLCNERWNEKGKNKVKNERKFRESYYNGAVAMIKEEL